MTSNTRIHGRIKTNENKKRGGTGMSQVHANSFYMTITESDLTKASEIADFETDYDSSESIYLSDQFDITSRTQLKEKVEDRLFDEYTSQWNRSDFACKKTTYGWSYEGHFIMNDGSMIEQNDKDFTHIIKFDVEVTYYTEVNAFDYLTK